jgi:hypothetical protein
MEVIGQLAAGKVKELRELRHLREARRNLVEIV